MLKIVKNETFPLQTLDKRMLVVVALQEPKFMIYSYTKNTKYETY